MGDGEGGGKGGEVRERKRATRTTFVVALAFEVQEGEKIVVADKQLFSLFPSSLLAQCLLQRVPC